MTPKIDNKSAKCCSGRLRETCEKNTPQKGCDMGAKGPKSDLKNEVMPGHVSIPGCRPPEASGPCQKATSKIRSCQVMSPFWHLFRSTFDGIWARSQPPRPELAGGDLDPAAALGAVRRPSGEVLARRACLHSRKQSSNITLKGGRLCRGPQELGVISGSVFEPKTLSKKGASKCARGLQNGRPRGT